MAVSRETRLIVGCCIMRERSWRAMQEFVDRLPLAKRYCSDALAVYQELMWPPQSEHANPCHSERSEESLRGSQC